MAILHAYQTPSGLDNQLRSDLEKESNCILGTVNPDGSPHLTEVLFSLDPEGRVIVPTPGTTRKAKNVRREPKATFFVSMKSGGWASCTGPARLIEGNEAAKMNRYIRNRLLTDAGAATIGVVLSAQEDTTIEIRPLKWLSWRSGPFMEAVVEAGADLTRYPPDTWFRDLSGGQE